MEELTKEINLIVFASIFLFILILVIISIVLLYQKKQRSIVTEKEAQETLFQQLLLQSQIEIQEQTFADISRELHDSIGQQLSLAKLQLSTLKGINIDSDIEKVQSIKDLISDSISQIRSISQSMLGEKITSIGLEEAIRTETERIQRLGIAEVSFFIDGEHEHIDDQKQIIIFRMVQEAINNAVKHAAATIIDIRMEYKKEIVLISVKDNGKGFMLDNVAKGIGLMNLRSRANTIDASLEINSQPGKGTLVEIVLPIT